MKWVRRIVGAGAVAGAAWALWRWLDRKDSTLEWQPRPFPFPPEPVPGPGPGPVSEPIPGPTSAVAAWVPPTDGACPVGHPVKAKLTSGIFHVPGGTLYDRTVPDRCYVDATAAEADGLRASKR